MNRLTNTVVALVLSVGLLLSACADATPATERAARHHAARHHAANARRHARTKRHTRKHRRARATPAPAPALTVAALVAGLKEVSYYPSQHPWGSMWYQWQPAVIDADMAKLAALGANTVRIFVQPASFGYPVPQPSYIAEFGQMLSIAAAHGLKVQVTLFDLWHSYTDIAGSEQWAGDLLAPFHADPRIATVELQNEIDPTNQQAISWAQTMLPAVRADSGRPVTVSVTGWNTASALGQLIAALGPSQPDFYDLHFYGTPPYMLSTFESAEQMVDGKPLLIGETGYSSAATNNTIPGIPDNTAAHEDAQAQYYREVEEAARMAGLAPAGVWVLNDFPPMLDVDATDQHFGLFRLDGSAKPAVAVVRAAFGG
jgi:endo-1,4-beta-mannosidase